MQITMEDVAREAGVSVMTVSRALGDSPLVANKTKQKILQTAQNLGYVPNLLARSLVQQKSPIVGLVVADLVNPFFAPILTAIQEIAWKHNHFVVIADSERQISKQGFFLEQFKRLYIGGMIITPLSADTSTLEALRDNGTPVVVIARRWEKGDYVSADNIAGGRMVAEHLIQMGHRQIGCISLNEPGHTAVTDRVSGFTETLREAGLNIPESCLIMTNSLRVEEGVYAADAFMELSPRPSAVFVVADRVAVGFVDRLIEHGLDIPNEVAVVGYDDIRYSAYLKVPLTTVSLPKEKIGQMAADILFERLLNPGRHRKWKQVLLKPELIVRASSGIHLL